jgi:hypothetical protein
MYCKTPANRQDLIMIHATAFLTVRTFWQKAGRLSVRAVRCRWQGFFSTSALSDEEIFAIDGLKNEFFEKYSMWMGI